LLTIFFLFEFPLTPRRVSLVNIFTIVLPAFVIALRNTNVAKTKNFTADIFSFVTISALFIAGAAHAGEHITPHFYTAPTETDIQMVMLSIMIITSVANFFAVALHKHETNIRLYLLYGLGILSGYIFLAATTLNFVPLNLLRKFYEIDYLASQYWSLVAVISIPSAVLLFLIQKLRERVVAR
jgi:magnesium-transporting ATPase (P-type)